MRLRLCRWLALPLAAGCSSVAEQPKPRQCEVSADCADTEVCQNGRCEDASKDPPLAHLGFDIQERASANEITFRAQIWGCDREVPVSPADSREIAISRSEVSQQFALQVHALEGVDFENPQPGDLLPAVMSLSQNSRLGRTPNRRDPIDHPTIAQETGAVSSSVVAWPRYHLDDQMQPPGHIVWETRPEAGPPVLRMFRPPQTDVVTPCTVDADCCEEEGCDPSPNYCVQPQGECSLIGNPSFIYIYRYEPQCDLPVVGDVVLYDFATSTQSALADATVRLRHADVPDEPRLGVFDSGLADLTSAERQCETDADCGSDLICEPVTGQCQLALAGRAADAGSTTSQPNAMGLGGGQFNTRVYTYCEADYGMATGTPSIERAYTVQISRDTGDLDTVSPTVTYEVTEAILPVNDQIAFTQRFCVPNWGAPVPLALELTGAPGQLVDGGGAATRCCDVGCLPPSADAVDPMQTGADTCDGTTAAGVAPSVQLEATLELNDEERTRWNEADCMPPVEGIAGRLSRLADCGGPGPCVALDVAAGDADGPRRYSVRIESPVGSVLGSRDVTVELDAKGLAIGGHTIELPPRVLVRGSVGVGEDVCARREDPEDDCASRGAIVLAERVADTALGETNANTPGPFFHQVSTFHDPTAAKDGAFVLPLDPGLWVLTALPVAGEDGGPAAFVALDLRDGQPPEPVELVLHEGILVTLNLRSFDRRSTVVPLDLGSWAGLSLPSAPDVIFDLSDTTTCLTPASESAQGCKIRQLIPPGSSLTLSQVGLARFTARAPTNASAAICAEAG